MDYNYKSNIYEFTGNTREIEELRERLEKPGITQEELDYCKEEAKKYRKVFK